MNSINDSLKNLRSTNAKDLFFFVLFALVVGGFYIGWNYGLLMRGHFHEDAYIMFIYVNNIVSGFGEVFYPGGAPAEGATDFLWLILLVVFGYFGVDPGFASIMLNALGVFVIVLVYLLSLRGKVDGGAIFFFLPWTLVWLLDQSLVAALGGFSVLLYASLSVLLVALLSSQRWMILVPLLCLVLGLFRPDGVIIGFFAFGVGLWIVWKSGGVKEYLCVGCVSLVLGVAYFVGRAAYFGEMLPLPLYVKSGGGALSGLGTSIDWLESNVSLLASFLIVGLFSRRLGKMLVLFVPFVMLFVALVFATQSQNVGFRFQAPIYFAAAFILFDALVNWYASMAFVRGRVLVVMFGLICFYFVAQNGIKNIEKSSDAITKHSYVNVFSYELAQLIPRGATLVLTEAGRMAYWNQHVSRIVDLVGLNSPYPAKNKVDVGYVNSLSPDVIMFHHAFVMDPTWIAKKYGPLNYQQLDESDRLFLVASPSISLSDIDKDKVKLASFVLLDYLRENFDSYVVFVVDYRGDGTYRHVFGFRKGLVEESDIVQLLSESFSCLSQCKSYFDMIGYAR